MRYLAFLLLLIPVAVEAQQPGPPVLLVDAAGNPFPSGTGSPPFTGAPPMTCVTNIGGGLQYCNFSGSGGGITPAQLALVPVENFGAVGDWNGTTGTDNTTSIQNAINSLQTANLCGQILLQAKLYKVTGTLTITSSCVGIAGTAQGGALLTGSLPSGIVSTSASADIVDVAGASSSALLEYNSFNDFVLERSVAPTGTATGLSFNYVAGAIVENVQVMDSARGFYFHVFPSRGVGRVENCLASWGFGSVTGYTGTMSGFYLDSADGNPMFSFRGRHLQAANNLASATGIHGVDIQGTAIQDVNFYELETASVDYGIYISHSGTTTNSSLDLHFWGVILDNSRTSGIFVNNATAATNGRIEFNGGYVVAPSGTGSAIDIEGSSGVNLTNLQMGPEGTAPNWILLNSTSSSSITNNSLIGVTTKAITLSGSTGNTISGNQITGSSATTLINLTSTSTYNAITGNNLQGTATTGMAWDATSINEYGYSTNAIGSGITTLASNANQPGYEQIVVSEHNGNPTLLLHNTDSAGYPQLGFQNNTGGAAAQGGIFLGGTTIVSPYTNTLWMFNAVGGLYLRGNGPITIDANTTGTPSFADLGVTNTHLATAGYGFASGGTKFTTTGCSISATAGGGSAGTFTLGANSCTAVITMNGATGATAPNGWTCQAHDRTAPTILIGGESSSTTTTASIPIPAGAGATDVISFSCMAF